MRFSLNTCLAKSLPKAPNDGDGPNRNMLKPSAILSVLVEPRRNNLLIVLAAAPPLCSLLLLLFLRVLMDVRMNECHYTYNLLYQYGYDIKVSLSIMRLSNTKPYCLIRSTVLSSWFGRVCMSR